MLNRSFFYVMSLNVLLLLQVSSACANDNYWKVWDSGSIIDDAVNSVAVDDLDNDGKKEIIAGSRNGKIYVFENKGDNTYEKVWESISLGRVDSVTTGDLDGDGKKEIVAGATARIYLFENTGNNNYQNIWNSGTATEEGTITTYIYSVAVDDLDKDGKKEIIAGSNQKLYVFENNGADSYQKVWENTVGYVSSVVGADVDNDNNREIVAGVGQKLCVFENTGDNTYQSVWETTLSGYVSVAVGNLDGDANKEIIAGAENNKVYVFENTVDNTYQNVWDSGATITSTVGSVIVGDLDGDSKQEIIAGSYDKKVYIFENTGDNTYQKVWDSGSGTITSWITSLSCGDLDNDGKQEIIAGTYQDKRVLVFENRDVVVVTPGIVEMEVERTQIFSAQALDENNNPIPNAEFTWSVTGGIGTVYGVLNQAVFGATQAGTGTVMATYGTQSGQAYVIVTAPSGSISGTITDAGTHNPIQNARVKAFWFLELLSYWQGQGSVTSGVSGTYTIPNLPAGTYSLEVLASGYYPTTTTGITVNLNQNTPNVNLLLQPYPNLPDLAISLSDIWWQPLNPVVGQPVIISARVHNIGLALANNIQVDFWKADWGINQNWTGLGTTTISSLPAGSSTIATLSITAATAGLNNVLVKLDSANSISEIYENNNFASKCILAQDVTSGDFLDLIIPIFGTGTLSLVPDEGGLPPQWLVNLGELMLDLSAQSGATYSFTLPSEINGMGSIAFTGISTSLGTMTALVLLNAVQQAEITGSGGTLTTGSDTTVLIPPGVLSFEALISANDIPWVDDYYLADQAALLDPYIEIPSILKNAVVELKALDPSNPAATVSLTGIATLTLSYPESLGTEGESRLKVFWLNPATNSWVPLSDEIINPASNTITVNITHFSLYRLALAPPPPSITITHPYKPGGYADTTYLIGWTDEDPDSNALITLYYDTDNTGTDGTLIISGISEDDETDYYEWSTSLLLPGTYFIYAKIEDGNSTVYSYSSGPLIIDHRPSDGKKLPWHDDGAWLVGDVHMHTTSSDGSYSAAKIAKQAESFGADFIAITDHGNSGLIGSESYHQAIIEARGTCTDLMVFEGVEWNVPGADSGGHANVFLTNSPDETQIIRDFNLGFDADDGNTVGTTGLALAGLKWLSTQARNGVKPICSLGHPSRASADTNNFAFNWSNGYTADKLRIYDDAGDVCIGFAADWGHKKYGSPFNFYFQSYMKGYHDPMAAWIGHHWDTLLHEGRTWWIRFECDFHEDGGDYWPTEFSQTRVYCPSKTYEGVMKGMRAGCAYAVHGNIITNLDFTASTGTTHKAMMGEIIEVENGGTVTASIRVRPSTGTTISKIELISDFPGTPTLVYTFTNWTNNAGWLEMSYNFTNVQHNFYMRLRGMVSALPVNKWFYSNPIRVVNRPVLIAISPVSGTVGTPVTISGRGFKPTEYIRIDFGTIERIQIAWADEKGSFTTTFIVHFQPSGLKTVTATGLLSDLHPTTTFNVTESGNPPAIINDLQAINPTISSVALKASAWAWEYIDFWREKQARKNLNILRAAIEKYYQYNGRYPITLDSQSHNSYPAFVPSYYLSRIPKATLRRANSHNDSNVVYVITGLTEGGIVLSQISDQGGWIYSPNSGDIAINCKCKDTGQLFNPAHNREYYKYGHAEDDGSIGINLYDFRYSSSPITDSNWNSTTKVEIFGPPSFAEWEGTITTTRVEAYQLTGMFLILGLSPDTTYYFAGKVSDERSNWSGVSNGVKAKTPATPEGVISNLKAIGTTATSAILRWTPLDWVNQVREIETDLNLKKIRTALTRYYKDAQGDWPSALASSPFIPNYLSALPKALLKLDIPHNESNGVTNVTTFIDEYISSNQITDQGGWIYSPNSADVGINCNHKDTGEREYYQYGHEVEVSWAFGLGTSTAYDIRYATSTSTITEANWAKATPIIGAISPRGGFFIAHNLSPNTTHYFALKFAFPGGTWSAISNIASCTTATAPVISDLEVKNPTTSSLTLTWTSVPMGDERLSTAKANLNLLKAAILSYYLDTGGIYPNELDATARTYNYRTTPPFIPGYLSEIPKTTLDLSNPHNTNMVTYVSVDASPIATSTITDAGGWIYHSFTDDIRINCSHNDCWVGGVPYFTHKAAGLEEIVPDTRLAAKYEIIYTTSPLDWSNWYQVTPATPTSTPKSPGLPETLTITGLRPDTTYYFGIMVSDELGNPSTMGETRLSNIASGAIIPPLPPLVYICVSPATATVLAGQTQSFTAQAYSQDGYLFSGLAFNWAVTGDIGRLTVGTGAATTFIAGTSAGAGSVTVTYDSKQGWASVQVVLPTAGIYTLLITDSTKDSQLHTGSSTVVDVPANTFSNPWMQIIVNDTPEPDDYELADSATPIDRRIRIPQAIKGVVRQIKAVDTAGWPIDINVPVKLTLPFPDSIDRRTALRMRIYRLNTTNNRWELVAGRQVVNPASRTVTAWLTHFSHFRLAESPQEAGTGATKVNPQVVNRESTGTTTISTTFYDADFPAIGSLSITFKVSSPGGTETILVDNKRHGEAGLQIIGEQGTYTASYVWYPPDTQPLGLYDLYFSVSDGVGSLTDGYENNPDELEILTTPPGTITNLSVATITATSITLTWTAPGDDGMVGTATAYDIRYATFTITEANWSLATPCSGTPTPGAAGGTTTFTVSGLGPNTTYYFAVKTADEVPNVSALSNIASATTKSSDTSAPGFGSWSSTPADLTRDSTGNFTVAVTITDAESGVATTTVQLDYKIGAEGYDGFEPMSYVGSNTWSFAIPQPAVGWNAKSGKIIYFQARAADVAGNMGTSTQQKEFIDGLVIEAGSLIELVGSLNSKVIPQHSGLYQPPDAAGTQTIKQVANLIKAGIANNNSGTLTQAAGVASWIQYELVEFSDSVTGKKHYILRETEPTNRGWGSYIFDSTGTSNLTVEVPHPLFDSHSPEVGIRAYLQSEARVFLMAGAHRNANGTGTADVAHLTNTIFETVHEEITGTNTTNLQIHGFSLSNHPGYPDIVLSAGTSTAPSVMATLATNLQTEGFTVGTYNGTQWSDLAAATNVQGIYTRGIGAAFIHIELESIIRGSSTLYEKVVLAIRETFIPGTQPLLTLTKTVSPTGSHCIGTTLTYILTYKNIGSGTAKSIEIVDMVPAGTLYGTGTASGEGCTIAYSHDGGVNFDSSEAPPVTHIRWKRSELVAGAEGTVRFEVTIQP